MSQLIIAEKPKAAGRIAYALADGNVEKKNRGKAVWYETDIGDEKSWIVPAVGHLFTLEQEEGDWDYPVFDIEWRPTHEVRDSSKWMKTYYYNLKRLANKADSFVNACDYDIEGEIIGYNILKFIVGTENAARMKFSTLTTSDLQEAYEDMSEELDQGMVESGLARHFLDYLWGINLSRALTLAVKSADSFKVLSTGRVQGPALKILADREEEIQKFEPEDYWVLEAMLKSGKGKVKARHEKEKFWEEREAAETKEKAERNGAKVKEVKKNKFKHKPPYPFDLSTLQSEAYSAFNFSPSKALDLAQSLYESGLISYPRTSVTGDEDIYIQKNGEKRIVKIGKFIDQLIEEREKDVEEANESEELKIDSYKTLSVDLETNKVKNRKINKVIRHPCEEDVYKVKTKGGREVKVSASHSLFTLKDCKLTPVATKDLEEGDYIAISEKIPHNAPKDEVNLIKRAYELGIENKFSLTKIKDTKIEDLTYKDKNGNDYRFRDSIPLDIISKYCSIEEIKNLPVKIRARSGKKGVEINPNIKISPEFGRLAGYFDSEGNKYKKKGENSSYEFCLVQDKGKVLEDMKNCIKKVLGVSPKIQERRKKNVRLRLHGKSIYNILTLLGLKGESLSKKTSPVILNSSEKILSEYLKAFTAGDGSIDEHSRSIKLSTVSKGLAQTLVFLLSRLGIDTKIITEKRGERGWNDLYKVCIFGKENIVKFKEKIGFLKEIHKKKYKELLSLYRLESDTEPDKIPKKLIDWKKFISGVSRIEKMYTGAHRTKNITSNQVNTILKKGGKNDYLKKLKKFFESDIYTSKIESIEKAESPRYVYDLSISDKNFENFIGGFGGVILHNSSQKLPPKIGYQKILKKLKNQEKYKSLAGKVLGKDKIYPKQGKKEDKAHPAIYPTGSKPKKVPKDERKLYDLIAKRYFAVFGDPALRESLKLDFDLSGEVFKAEGKRTLDPNWFELYEPYVRKKEQKVPDLKEGEKLEVEKMEKLDKQTQPPDRYTQASLVTELKKSDLGTKATRSQIIDKLYDRGYIDGSSIRVTDIGLAVVDALEEYSPEVLSEEMTRKFEEEMEEIREGENEKEEVVEGAKEELKDILEEIKENEREIGQELKKAVIKTKKKKSELGECPECGGTLKIIKTKNGQFVGCSNYPDCDNSFPLPQNAKIIPQDKKCKECGLPMIKVIRKGKKPFTMCISPDCKSKEDWD